MESTYSNLSNTTSNASNFTAEDFVSGYIALGVAHLLVVVLPCAIFAPMLLAVLLKDKASRRDPVVTALVCTVLPSLVGPLGNGWLLDLSLITDKPFFGNCASHTGILYLMAETVQIFQTHTPGVLSAIQCILIRHGTRAKLTSAKVTAVFIALFAVTAIFIFGISGVRYFFSTCRLVRGSYTVYQPFSSVINELYILAPRIAFPVYALGPPLIVILICSIVSYKFIRKNLLKEHRKVAKSTALLAIVLFASVLILRVPQAIAIAINENSDFIRFAGIYTLEINYTLNLLLIVLVHKTTRAIVVKKLRHIFGKKSSSRVYPL